MPSLDGVLHNLGDELSRAANSAWDSVRGDAQQFIDAARKDLANAVGDIGAGATNAITGKIAPASTAPVAVPLTQERIGYLVAAFGAVLVVVYLVARRR